MMGSASNPGLIPRIAKRLFERIDDHSDENALFACEASYLEIYNERVRDLYDFSINVGKASINHVVHSLDPHFTAQTSGAGLTVREHPMHGPYVESLILSRQRKGHWPLTGEGPSRVDIVDNDDRAPQTENITKEGPWDAKYFHPLTGCTDRT